MLTELCIECSVCGDLFSFFTKKDGPGRPRTKCDQCRRYKKKVPKEGLLKPCDVCGESIKVVKDRKPLLCSHCHRKQWYRRTIETKNANRACVDCGASIANLHGLHIRCKDCGPYKPLDLPERSCEVCGKSYKPKATKGRYCSRACHSRKKGKKYECTCTVCGTKWLASRKDSQFCSVACGNKSGNKWAGISKERRSEIAKQRWYANPSNIEARIRSQHRAYIEAGQRQRTCDECGRTHSRRPDATTCSRRCSKARARRLAWELRRAPINCKWCGVWFSRLKGDADNRVGAKVTCSDECEVHIHRDIARAHKAKRRAMKKTNGPYERISPRKVFERDGWHCCGCGAETPSELRGTYDDNAPEMDHIVPLSKGGTHTMDNVHLLCRLCNLLKSDMDWREFQKQYINQRVGAG